MTQCAYRPADLRRIILDESYRAHVGHIGSALSVADIVWALFAGAPTLGRHGNPDRDRLVMSKGHAALALYAALHLEGLLPADELSRYCGDGSRLGVHPDRDVPGIDFTTGSLGQGLSLGVGAALAARLQGSTRRVFVLLSDAECNEGATWEAIMFAAHHGLSNLTAIVDSNGQQALGYTRDVLNLDPLAARWAAFGWEAVDVDGHDGPGLAARLAEVGGGSGGRPRVLVARTDLGKGVSFMERLIKWHYWPMSADEYAQARRDIGADVTGGAAAGA